MTSIAMPAFTLDTPDGPFGVITSADGVVLASGWTDDLALVAARNSDIGVWDIGAWRAAPPFERVEQAVRAYYDGDPGPASLVPVHQPGTPFLQSVWTALRGIGPGERMTYGELATELGRPTAARAVGRACGLNAPALFVPCHRVVGASGALTGFAWGTAVKRSLLEREARR